MNQLVGPALGLCRGQCVKVSMIGMGEEARGINVHGLPNKG